MAREVRLFSVTVPVNTTAAAPQVTQMRMPPRVVEEVEVRVPPGPRGEVGFRIGSSGTQLLPLDLGAWIITDDEVIHWPLEGQHDSGSWEFTAYNTGAYGHTFTVRFLVNLAVQAAVPAQAPLPAGELSSGGSGLLPVPSLDLPPLPGPPLLPPLSLPPPPALPPLPGLGDLSGAAAAAPQPRYNWWYDAMGRLLTYPDQQATTRFDEVFLMQDGSVGWYAWSGGAGSWEGYQHPAGSLGGNFVDVSACFTLYQGVIRLNIVATAADGTRSIKVMNAGDFSVLSDWAEQPGAQSRELAFSKRTQAGPGL